LHLQKLNCEKMVHIGDHSLNGGFEFESF
jgi:hypothetical protein